MCVLYTNMFVSGEIFAGVDYALHAALHKKLRDEQRTIFIVLSVFLLTLLVFLVHSIINAVRTYYFSQQDPRYVFFPVQVDKINHRCRNLLNVIFSFCKRGWFCDNKRA